MSGFVEDAVADRVSGRRSGRLKAIVAAILIGIGAAVLAYKLLRGASYW